MNTRPFRFGVITESTSSREEWITLVRRVEELGYATFLLADHYVNEFPPLTALMAAAAATQTLRVGTLVFDNDFRHPAMLAKEAATLDLLSGGRFELGIGAGWHKPEYEQVGIPFDPAGVRISRLEEALAIIKQFFTQETVTFAGNHYHVNNLKAFPRPVQRPHLPIVMGGGGKRLLSLAGREADSIGLHVRVKDNGPVDPSERTEDALAQKVEWVKQAAGERFSTLELNLLMGHVAITQDPEQAAEAYLREQGRTDLTMHQFLASPYTFIGSIEQLTAKVQRLRELFGISYFVLDAPYMEAFAPIVASLTQSCL